MNLKNNILTTLLLAIGFILHYITPGILGGMKFDFLLIFIIISLLINTKIENAILTGLFGGILSAMTTTFPGGQIPNILDKIITCLVLFIVIKVFYRFSNSIIMAGFIGGLGTLVSGTIFLLSAKIIVGLPAPIFALIIGVVLPTVVVNGIGTSFIYKIVKAALKSSGFATN